MEIICDHCGKKFTRLSHIPAQRYCSRVQCQNARRQKWRKQKLAIDKDYKANQKDAQGRWCEKNPDYWNSLIAKRYALPSKNSFLSGYYRLVPVVSELIAKRYALLVKIDAITTGCPQDP